VQALTSTLEQTMTGGNDNDEQVFVFIYHYPYQE